MWICGQDEIIESFFYRLSQSTTIINCKDSRVPNVDRICRPRGNEVLEPLNIGYHWHRKERFEYALDKCIATLNRSGAVVVHCRGGIHRAPFTCALILMHLKCGTSFGDAMQQVQEIRPQTDCDGIVYPSQRQYLSYTECMLNWILDWDEEAITKPYHTQIHETQ